VLKLQSKEHICFFIDGLDEHDGEYMTLLDLVLRTRATPNVKICLSSRPEPAFRLRLCACPSISMQDLNKHDIETLVQQKLEPLGSTFTSLIEEVTERAEGIILWAALVCNSLLRGYTMYDDEPMLRKRLDDTPSGLRELFRHMFSKIDNAHRDNLRIYCHILKWASEIKYKTYYTSLTFVTAVSQSSGIASLESFVRACPSREQQIVAQSQGLIEVGRQEDNPVLGLWSVRQTVDQGIIQSQTHDLTKELFEHSRHHIRWVHRSAHDCIFGERGETIAQWIFLDDDLELKRKSVDCLLWLAEHLPMVFMSQYDEFVALVAAFDDLIRDIILLTSYDEGFPIAGKLHDLVASVFPGRDRRSCRKELQDVAAGRPSDIDEMLPLYSLWVGILEIGRHSYFDHLVQKPFAAHICGSLIWNGAAGGDDDLSCRLLSHVLRYFQPWTDSNLPSGSFLHNRRLGYQQHSRRFSQSTVNPIIISWHGSLDHDEGSMIHDLATFRGSTCDPSLSSRFWLQVLGLFEARKVWRGPQAVDQDDCLLPLQLLLPNSEFLQMCAASQSSAMTSPALPASRFRMMCLRRNQRIPVSRTWPHEVTHEHEAVAMFDLSTTATEALMLQSQWWTPEDAGSRTLATMNSLGMTWVGTAADYTSCLQVILDDIWQDRDQQLNAWQQLYALACLKLCFGRMWKIGNEARVARWTENAKRPYFEYPSTSESSSDDGLKNERDPLEEPASAIS
jgi:hypothetical protein